MTFLSKDFVSLSTRELHDIYQLRAEVFVVEQRCPYQDVDGKDPACRHVMLYDSELLIAYCRLLPAGLSYASPSIGRVVVRASHRGKGTGEALMKFALTETKAMFRCSEIIISAQCYLEKFYCDLGFVPEGEVYPEDDIPHRKMRLKI